MAYSVSFDATKVVRGVAICTRFNTIVEVVFTQHYISQDVKRDYDIKKMIHEIKNINLISPMKLK